MQRKYKNASLEIILSRSLPGQAGWGSPSPPLKPTRCAPCWLTWRSNPAAPTAASSWPPCFWPGWPDASARTSLRNALSNLRHAIGDETADPPFLLITRETIQFNPESDYSLDTLELERITKDSHATADQLQSALDLYRGGFLEGFTLKDCPAFDDWSLVVREQLQAQASTPLSRLAELYEKTKEYEKAIGCARKRLELEPWQEDAHRQLMRLLAASAVSARLPWRSSRPASAA